MRLIKLDATTSTNDYLRALSVREELSNFTTVSAEYQTDGRGQRGASWNSNKGKNLMFSTFFRTKASADHLFTLNVAVAVSLLEALEAIGIPGLAIKWPNDILAERRKVSGVLIENQFKAGGGVEAVIGIGLNVNQTDFEGLPNAASLKTLTDITYDRDALLGSIVGRLSENLGNLEVRRQAIWEFYHANLFGRNQPAVYETPDGQRFNGMITEVTPSGKLGLIREDDSVSHYDIKEIRMLY